MFNISTKNIKSHLKLRRLRLAVTLSCFFLVYTNFPEFKSAEQQKVRDPLENEEFKFYAKNSQDRKEEAFSLISMTGLK